MISEKTVKSIEFDKILNSLSEYAVLDATKDEIISFSPLTDINAAKNLLAKTAEAYKLLYQYGVGGIYYFSDVTEQLKRVDMGGVLNNAELLRIAENLKSSRLMKSSVASVNDDGVPYIKEVCSRLYVNPEFEKEITSKIISEDEISDTASPKLYSIRKNIRDINARIRNQLTAYMHGSLGKIMQDSVVTMRQNRYVIPVKSEYRSQVKGFIHDQSASGATVFIEPEIVIELNNDLKRATFDEQEEIRKILQLLSEKVTFMSDAIRYNAENLVEIDNAFARAAYSFDNKCTYPLLNDKGIIDVKKGRHPLIAKDKVVPVSVRLGKDYNFLLITGPNTGGKTVTLKLVGLFSLMAMSGLYIPAEEESVISVYSGVYSDIGDEQSIEQDLSTFSSHVKNLINILNVLDDKSLVLIDEIGAGTDPEEGSALALAIINRLIKLNCFGIITTHYSRLKEFAFTNGKIMNACMEFDAATLRPLYKINIGIPGSSNAIEISKTLGLDRDIIEEATSYLSTEKISFENVLKKAEEERLSAEAKKELLERIKSEKDAELAAIKAEKERIVKEREKIYQSARQETKRIVAEKLSEAEEIIDELKGILRAAGLESKEVIRASALKNRLKNSKYLSAENEDEPLELVKADLKNTNAGDRVYVKSLGSYAKIVKIKNEKGEAEVLIGDIKTVVKLKDLFNNEKDAETTETVKINRPSAMGNPKAELNVVGKTSLEALTELENFIDQAVRFNLEEIKIIHGVGEGILLKAVRNYLKTDKNVKEFRRGRYGEGENGVTIVTLK